MSLRAIWLQIYLVTAALLCSGLTGRRCLQMLTELALIFYYRCKVLIIDQGHSTQKPMNRLDKQTCGDVLSCCVFNCFIVGATGQFQICWCGAANFAIYSEPHVLCRPVI